MNDVFHFIMVPTHNSYCLRSCCWHSKNNTLCMTNLDHRPIWITEGKMRDEYCAHQRAQRFRRCCWHLKNNTLCTTNLDHRRIQQPGAKLRRRTLRAPTRPRIEKSQKKGARPINSEGSPLCPSELIDLAPFLPLANKSGRPVE